MRALSAAIVALACLTAGAAPAASADIKVSASVSDDNVVVGDALTLEISVVSHADGSISLELPKWDGFTELSRSKSEGTSIQWGTGGQQVTKEYTITIELQAEKDGTLTIPAIGARVGNTRATSEAITIRVAKGDEPGNATPGSPGQVAPPSPGEERLFVRYNVDRATAFVGEQIILDLDVYALPSTNFAIDEAPPPATLDGFWREILDQPQRLTRRMESVDGRSYAVYRLWRVAIFGLDAGERVIPSGTIGFSMNRSLFGGGSRDRRKAPPITIEILPLPNDGKPAGFSAQNVGIYELAASIDSDKVPAGKALVLKLDLGGKGNVKNLRFPAVEVPGFRAFAPTITDDLTISPQGVSGTKHAEILLMPERVGRLEIPSFEVPIFNTAEKRYQRLSTPTMRVVVEGDASQLPTVAQPSAAGDEKEETKTAKTALRPIRFRSSLASRKTPPWSDATFGALVLAPPFLYLLLLAGGSVFTALKKETPDSKKRAKARAARTKLELAKNAAHSGDTALAFREFYDAFIDLASDKTGVLLRGLTIDETKSALAKTGASPALIDSVARELERADYARFAPEAIDKSTLAGAADSWDSLFTEIERLT